MTLLHARRIFAKALRGLGYSSVLLQWLWILILLLPPLIDGGALESFTTTAPTETSQIEIAPVQPSPLSWIIAIIIMLVILAVTILIFIRIPKAILQTGEVATTKAAHAVVPIITHHKPLPAKRKRELSRRVVFAIQLLSAVTPGILCFFVPAYREITKEIVVSVGVFMLLASVLSFVAARFVMPHDKRLFTSRTQSHASHE